MLSFVTQYYFTFVFYNTIFTDSYNMCFDSWNFNAHLVQFSCTKQLFFHHKRNRLNSMSFDYWIFNAHLV